MTIFVSPGAAQRAGLDALHAHHLARYEVLAKSKIEADRSRSRGWVVVLYNRKGQPVLAL